MDTELTSKVLAMAESLNNQKGVESIYIGKNFICVDLTPEEFTKRFEDHKEVKREERAHIGKIERSIKINGVIFTSQHKATYKLIEESAA